MDDYYVYVYIDPRNFEEFYYGKGQGSRKEAHEYEAQKYGAEENEKLSRIAEIQKEGLKPIIRVVARNLSEHDALLVEKTLLWKLGRSLTNISSGHYSQHFRPPYTMHVPLNGFDYQSGIYYYNVGEGTHRNWDDYQRYGFISAGQGVRWRDAILGFQPGDIIAAYLKGHGFVGIGQISERARPIREVVIENMPLLNYDLTCKNMSDNVQSNELCEYVAPVKWLRSVARSEAKWKARSGLFTTTHVRASLERQPATMEFLEDEFGINLKELVI